MLVAVAGSKPRAQRVDVHDLHPVGWVTTGLPRTLQLAPGSSTRFDYTLRPTERGDARFEGVHLRLHSPWRLWRRMRVVGPERKVRVYPDFAPLARLALLGAETASRAVGAHVKRRRGEGTDFHAVAAGNVSITPLQVDLTDHASRGDWASRLGAGLA